MGIYLLYLGMLLAVPMLGAFSPFIILLVTLSLFFGAGFCIYFFRPDIYLSDILKASMIATGLVLLAIIFATNPMQHTLGNPLYGLLILAFGGIFIALYAKTNLESQQTFVASSASLGALWMLNSMLKAGTIAHLFGRFY